jgi:4-hydroxybenzoate polyprenyltransferase
MSSRNDETQENPSSGMSRRSLKGYLDLCRVSNLPTVWTNVLTALMLAGTGFSTEPFVLLCLSMSFFYSGGMCLNDIIDIGVDRLKRPSRPIPSARVPMGKAVAFTVILFLLASGFLVLTPFPKAFFAGLLLLIVIIAYDMLHKAHPWTVLLMAGCRLMIYVVVSVAMTGTVVVSTLVAGSIQFAYIVAISIIARYENRLARPFGFPVIPVMLACICLLDGLIMAVFLSPAWLLAGIAGTLLTRYGQRYVRGD